MNPEVHPYGTFIPLKAESLIIGSFPIGKFTNPERQGEIKAHEFRFFFGGEKNLLWRLLGDCFGRKLTTREEIIALLTEKKIGIGDVIESCRRRGGRASDSDLYDICWNTELLNLIKQNKIKRVFFTSRQVENWFSALYPEEHSLIRIQLLSPSAQSARSIARMEEYRAWKLNNPLSNTYEFLLKKYKEVFNIHHC